MLLLKPHSLNLAVYTSTWTLTRIFSSTCPKLKAALDPEYSFPLLKHLTGEQTQSIARFCGFTTLGVKDEKKKALELNLLSAQNLAIKRYLLHNKTKNLDKAAKKKNSPKLQSIFKGNPDSITLPHATSIYSYIIPEYTCSIDVGYKNLAFCALSKSLEIAEWKHIQLLEKPTFDPASLAVIVRDLVNVHFTKYPYEVANIFVEKQHFRNNGGSGVFNPALINGVIEALIFSNVQPFNSCIKSVLPGNVSKLFQLTQETPKAKAKVTTRAKAKKRSAILLANHFISKKVALENIVVPKVKSSNLTKQSINDSFNFYAAESNPILQEMLSKHSKHFDTDLEKYLSELLSNTLVPINCNNIVTSFLEPNQERKTAKTGLNDNMNWLNLLKKEKKKDDLADSYLQAIASVYWESSAAYTLSLFYHKPQFEQAFKAAFKQVASLL